MLNLIRSDMYKLKKAKSFWICVIISIALSVLMTIVIDLTYKMIDDSQSQASVSDETMQENGMNISIGNTPLTYDDLSGSRMLLTNFGSDASILIAIFISLFVSGEFTYGTIKNLASKNCSRTQIYLSKLMISIGSAIFLTLLSVAISTLAGTALWGFGEVSSSGAKSLVIGSLIELLLITAFASLFVMVSMVVRQNGVAIAANFCILQFVSLLVMLGEMAIKKIFDKTVTLSNYLISTNMNQVATQELTQKLITRSILVAISFIAVTTAIGIISFNKRDIK